MDNKTMGQIICEYRKQKGLTQKALAEQLNVTDKAVSKWERDIARPSIDMIPDLASILEIPVETLLNITTTEKDDQESSSKKVQEEDIVPVVVEEVKTEEWDPEREARKDYVRHLVVNGLFGFAAGFLFVIITSLSRTKPIDVTFAFMVGLLMAGAPYGWELLGKIIGNWYVVGSIPIMIIVSMFKLFGAILIGWVAYPIALLYNLMKSQRKGSKRRIVYSVLLVVFISLIVIFLVWMTTVTSNRGNVSESIPTTNYSQEDTISDTSQKPTVAPERLVTDGAVFDVSHTTYVAICESALEKSIAKEQAEEKYGYDILVPSSIKAAYFMTVKEPESEHYDYGENVYISNAILIVTSYEVEILHDFKKEEFTIWFYPNFVIDADGMIKYMEEEEYDAYLGSEGLADVYEWICEEYDDMTIMELEIP